MTSDEVKQRVEVVRNLALIEDDNEVAHAAEDKLWEDVLCAIADGVRNPIELATEALKTREISYQRWYA